MRQVLEKLEFICIRQSGSHAVYHHADGRWTTVPMHKGKDLGKGILEKSLKMRKLALMNSSNCVNSIKTIVYRAIVATSKLGHVL